MEITWPLDAATTSQLPSAQFLIMWLQRRRLFIMANLQSRITGVPVIPSLGGNDDQGGWNQNFLPLISFGGVGQHVWEFTLHVFLLIPSQIEVTYQTVWTNWSDMISGEQKWDVDYPWAWINKEGIKILGKEKKAALRLRLRASRLSWVVVF